MKHLRRLGIRKSWVTPLSVFITVLLANRTASFVDKFGIEGSVWEAVFMLITIGSAIWFAVSIIRLCIHWKKSSLDDLIDVIKNAKK